MNDLLKENNPNLTAESPKSATKAVRALQRLERGRGEERGFHHREVITSAVPVMESESFSLDLSPENWDDTALLRAYEQAKRHNQGQPGKPARRGAQVHDKAEPAGRRVVWKAAPDPWEDEVDLPAEGQEGEEAGQGSDESDGTALGGGLVEVEGEREGDERYLNEEWADYYHSCGVGERRSDAEKGAGPAVAGREVGIFDRARDLALLSLGDQAGAEGLADLMASWYCAGYQAGLQRHRP